MTSFEVKEHYAPGKDEPVYSLALHLSNREVQPLIFGASSTDEVYKRISMIKQDANIADIFFTPGEILPVESTPEEVEAYEALKLAAQDAEESEAGEVEDDHNPTDDIGDGSEGLAGPVAAGDTGGVSDTLVAAPIIERIAALVPTARGFKGLIATTRAGRLRDKWVETQLGVKVTAGEITAGMKLAEDKLTDG